MSRQHTLAHPRQHSPAKHVDALSDGCADHTSPPSCRIMTDVPPESVTTDCGGDTPRVMQLLRDDDGEIVWRSTHPDRFCRVHAEGEHVAVSCSQCGGHVSVPEPDASKTWEEQIRLFGSSKHTPTCALRRSRHGTVPDDAEDLKSKHQISLSRAKKRAPPPLPSDAGKLRESFPFPPFSVSNGLPI